MPKLDKTASTQITQYATDHYPKYVKLSEFLHGELQTLIIDVAPHAIVQTRAKSVPSFAEKIFRKPHENPCGEFTDLCGGRIITHTTDEAKAVSQLIEERYNTDAKNFADHTSRLKPGEFGYRSVHYIVRFAPEDLGSTCEDLCNMENLRAEIQIRTLLEHAWADVSYEYAYKPDFEMPVRYQRETFCVAALLEDADDMFSRIRNGLRQYSVSYGTYMSPSQIREKIELLRFVLDTAAVSDREKVELSFKIGSLALELDKKEDWATAIQLLDKQKASKNPAVLLRLGSLICLLRCDNPKGREFLEGQHYLQSAVETSASDVEPYTALAATYERQGRDSEARKCYSHAFSIEPSSPSVLRGFLSLEIDFHKNFSVVDYLRPIIHNAIQLSRQQIDVKINLPWAFYNAGFFHLLLGEQDLSLTAYCKAVELSYTTHAIDQAAESVRKLEHARGGPPHLEIPLTLLELSSTAKAGEMPTAPFGYKPITQPVVVISGSNCDPTADTDLENQYAKVITPFLSNFKGTIICDGIRQGISKTIADVIDNNDTLSRSITLIGYLPRNIPQGIHVDKEHYEIRTVNSMEFSALQPLQKWSDIFKSGIHPSEVKVLGIGGDNVSGFEYQMALALGVGVYLLSGSGGKADEVLDDEDWKSSDCLFALPQDPLTIFTFLIPRSEELESSYRDGIARTIHDNYRR
ncbi:uncharacterized protein BDW43DRAFT_48053 [Aspergillus alliaceus]|uniref:uncharacterized protein n=1 Tax=Petromyces alliaceus TaxID=209559 RepID=UPI0012A4F0FD|nr:uncharacterized protein BDW43DRAFT_48053 [Aspergillus alliaceus]KAB8234959.1 hypothetical protein BDW43DRAFT_48053 [Aspergillus alliaceus]